MADLKNSLLFDERNGKCALHSWKQVLFYKWKVYFPMIYGGEFIVQNKLEELRKERGIRQEELAEALEVSRQTIGSLENGRYNPSIILAFKIARYFARSIEEIFIYEEE